VSVKDKACTLTVCLNGVVDAFLELYEASLEQQHFEKAFGFGLRFEVAKFAGPGI
jgi:hypothetical protein